MYVPTYLFHSPTPHVVKAAIPQINPLNQALVDSVFLGGTTSSLVFVLFCLCSVSRSPRSRPVLRVASCFSPSTGFWFRVLPPTRSFPPVLFFFSFSFFLFPPTAPRWTTTHRRSVSRADSVITLLFVRSSIRGLLEHRYCIRRSAVSARSIPSLKRRGLVPSQSWRRCPLSTCEMVFGTFLRDLDHAISWLLAE